MRYTGSGSVLAAAGSSYLISGLTAAAIALVIGGIAVLILGGIRRGRDRDAIRRMPYRSRS